MDSETVLFGLLVCLLVAVAVIIVGAFVLVAIWIPTMLGLNGIMWWAVAIVTFSLLTGLAEYLRRDRRE